MTTAGKIEEGAGPAKRSSSKTETIGRVLEAARREFAANGIARANMEAIARGAGVTKQLLYQYFESKHDLFSAVLDQASAEVMPKLLAIDFGHLAPVEALGAFADEVFEQYRADPMLGRLAREGMGFHEDHHSTHNRFVGSAPALAGKLEEILIRGIKSGDFRPELDTRACLALVSLMMTGGFTNSYTLSVILGADTVSPEGMDAWRQTAKTFIVEALRAKGAPAIP